MTEISHFKNDYEWLSNFSYFGGCQPTVEHAFQASKATNVKDAIWVMQAGSPKEAKRRGRTIEKRPDWDDVRVDVMHELLVLKFSIEPVQSWLINTGDAKLIEGNWWGDTFWGICEGKGENILGELLMIVREYYRESYNNSQS